MNLQTALTIGRMAERVEQIFQTQQYILQELKRMSTAANALDAQIANLTADVAAETTVEQSAITLINGIPTLIANAVAAAQAAGATPAELAALTALGTSITNSSAGLAAAVTANTPAPAAPPASS